MDAPYEDIVANQHLKYGFRCFPQKADPNFNLVQAHWHEYIELLYFLDGTADIFLDGRLHKIGAGDLLIINSREVHRIHLCQPSTLYHVIQFDPDMLHMSSTVFTLKYVLPFTSGDKQYPRLFRKDHLRYTPIPKHIETIMREVDEEQYAYELAVQGNINILFTDIVRTWHRLGIDINNDSFLKDAEVDRLRSALSFIDKHYHQNISAKEAAKLCNMSYNYFTARFKQVLGRSFTSHLNLIRLMQAEQQLVATDNSITDIAYNCGFSSTSYFISKFSKYKGITPKQYRKQLKNPVK